MLKFLKKWFWKICTINGRFFTKKQVLIEAQEIRTSLKTSAATSVDINQLITALGGIDNIKTVSGTVNTVKVILSNYEKINKPVLVKIGVKGLMVNEHNLKMIFGDDSKVIANQIDQAIQFNAN
ncbi:PTS transporter system subunit IIB [[Mycoplasma] cavipharyngis]|uniref:hypothetical protein n=1 Tax=[Mycoplasma] cavipharyngis TaxID=92757 RepID=UPI00370372A3